MLMEGYPLTLSQIPLTIGSVPEPYDVETGSINYQFRVTLEGPKKEIEAIQDSDIKISVNLDSLPFNEEEQKISYTLPITPEANVALAGGFKNIVVRDVVPNTVQLTLVHMTTKNLTLVIFPDGPPAENYEMTELELIPPAVEVKGPTRLIDDLTVLIAENAKVLGETKTVERPVLFRSDDVKDMVIPNLTQLRYRAVIQEIQETIAFPQPMPIRFTDPTFEAVSVNEVSLEISGPITAVKWADPNWAVPTVDPATAVFSVPSEPAPKIPEKTEDNPEDPADSAPPRGLLTAFIDTRWEVPEEVIADYPDWRDKVNSIQVRWLPSEIVIQEVVSDKKSEGGQ